MEISVYVLGKSYFAESLVETKGVSLRESPKDIDIFILGTDSMVWRKLKASTDGWTKDFGRYDRINEVFLKTKLENKIAKPNSFFIIDRCDEGSHDGYRRFEIIREFLIRHFKIPKNRILALTTNKDDVSSWIKYFHWAWKMIRDINLKESKHKADKPYKFLCLLGTPRASKLTLLLYMIHFNLLEHGMWSAPTFGDSLWKTASSGNAWWVRSNPELTKLIKRHRNEVAEITPKILDAKINSNFTKNKAAWAGSINNKFYEETYFSIVAETDFSDKKHKVNRYTEKTYKCFPMMHPFIVAGNPFVLKNLREDGFKTFHPHIDESYDKMCNLKDRINAIMKESQRLCSLSTSEWARLLNDLTPILLHNKKVAAKAPMIKTNINNIIT